jgi:uncharacterized membrane protein YidH (DUF202 family)
MAQEHESKQVEMMQQMLVLAEKQTAYSIERSEMSETRSYHNAERTLSVWVRTALAVMICGLAIDRFELLLGESSRLAAHGFLFDQVSGWVSIALVLFGVIMAMTTGLRFLAYARAWRQRHELPAYHGPYLGTFFALMVALFGIILLAIMMAARLW